MNKLNVGILPNVICSSLLILVMITTTLSYLNTHVTTAVPYISDTGTIPPESCIFGLVLNILWVIITIAIYLKYKQVEGILLKHNIPNKDSFNKRALYVGLLAAFGVTIVGSFQETTVFVVHWLGAFMVFGFGSIYISMQTVLYMTISSVIDQQKITIFRILISSLSVISYTVCFITALISYNEFQGTSYLTWTKKDGGFMWHSVSAVSEWVCSICIIIYILAFTTEFRSIWVCEPEIFIDNQTIIVTEPISVASSK